MDTEGFVEYRKLLKRTAVALENDHYFEICLFKGEEYYILQGIMWVEDFYKNMSIGNQVVNLTDFDRLDSAEIVFAEMVRQYSQEEDLPQSY